MLRRGRMPSIWLGAMQLRAGAGRTGTWEEASGGGLYMVVGVGVKLLPLSGSEKIIC